MVNLFVLKMTALAVPLNRTVRFLPPSFSFQVSDSFQFPFRRSPPALQCIPDTSSGRLSEGNGANDGCSSANTVFGFPNGKAKRRCCSARCPTSMRTLSAAHTVPQSLSRSLSSRPIASISLRMLLIICITSLAMRRMGKFGWRRFWLPEYVSLHLSVRFSLAYHVFFSRMSFIRNVKSCSTPSLLEATLRPQAFRALVPGNRLPNDSLSHRSFLSLPHSLARSRCMEQMYSSPVLFSPSSLDLSLRSFLSFQLRFTFHFLVLFIFQSFSLFSFPWS